MTIDIKYEQMPLSESLNGIVTKKLERISKKYPWVIRTEVIFKMETRNQLIERQCNISMSALGPILFANATEDNFEKSAKVALKRIERQLKKRKEGFQKKYYEKDTGSN